MSKITGKVYKKFTGISVTKEKNKGKKESKKIDPPPIEELQEYYKRITNKDQKQAISTRNILDNKLKESVDIKDCNEEATYLKIVTEKINLNIKGKKHHIPSRYEIMKASNLGNLL